jgi:hypothetical protein
MELAATWEYDVKYWAIVTDPTNWKDYLHGDNPNYTTGTFSDSGFKEEYQQELPDGEEREPGERYEGFDQVQHFVGFMGAGFWAPTQSIAEAFLLQWEVGSTDTADYRLGLAAIEVGRALNDYYLGGPRSIGFPASTPAYSGGMAPSEVGDWILKNLKE